MSQSFKLISSLCLLPFFFQTFPLLSQIKMTKNNQFIHGAIELFDGPARLVCRFHIDDQRYAECWYDSRRADTLMMYLKEVRLNPEMVRCYGSGSKKFTDLATLGESRILLAGDSAASFAFAAKLNLKESFFSEMSRHTYRMGLAGSLLGFIGSILSFGILFNDKDRLSRTHVFFDIGTSLSRCFSSSLVFRGLFRYFPIMYYRYDGQIFRGRLFSSKVYSVLNYLAIPTTHSILGGFLGAVGGGISGIARRLLSKSGDIRILVLTGVTEYELVRYLRASLPHGDDDL